MGLVLVFLPRGVNQQWLQVTQRCCKYEQKYPDCSALYFWGENPTASAEKIGAKKVLLLKSVCSVLCTEKRVEVSCLVDVL